MWILVTLLATVMLHPAHGGPLSHYPHLESARPHDRVLIVAPHIDDESIGAGGYAIDAIADGAEVYVVFMTAGDCNRFSARLMYKTLDPTAATYLSVGRARITEAQQAMQLLGVPREHYFILGYPDRGLRTMLEHPAAVVRSRGTHFETVPYGDALSPGSEYNLESLLSDLRHVIRTVNPTQVIAPVPFDQHPDHAATAELVDRALAGTSCHPQRLGYLIHTSRIPTALVNTPARALLPPLRMRTYSWETYTLSPAVQQKKTKLLMVYRSQRPYVFLLRNAFVRRNELFFIPQEPATLATTLPPAAPVSR